MRYFARYETEPDQPGNYYAVVADSLEECKDIIIWSMPLPPVKDVLTIGTGLGTKAKVLSHWSGKKWKDV